MIASNIIKTIANIFLKMIKIMHSRKTFPDIMQRLRSNNSNSFAPFRTWLIQCRIWSPLVKLFELTCRDERKSSTPRVPLFQDPLELVPVTS